MGLFQGRTPMLLAWQNNKILSSFGEISSMLGGEIVLEVNLKLRSGNRLSYPSSTHPVQRQMEQSS
jgi:hypothetical protein